MRVLARSQLLRSRLQQGLGRSNLAQVQLQTIAPGEEDAPGRPAAQPRSVDDLGLGDMLRHDAERLRILLTRHRDATGSARAAAMLDSWEDTLPKFVKVYPRDYRRVLEKRREMEQTDNYVEVA